MCTGSVCGRNSIIPCSPSDQQRFRLPSGQELVPDSQEGFIFERISGRFLKGFTGNGKRLGPVRFHGRKVAPFNAIPRVRVRGDHFARRAGHRGDLVNKILVQKALAVIFEDNRINLGQQRLDGREGACLRFRL
jgi:hypothetical protein